MINAFPLPCCNQSMSNQMKCLLKQSGPGNRVQTIQTDHVVDGVVYQKCMDFFKPGLFFEDNKYAKKPVILSWNLWGIIHPIHVCGN